MSENADQKAYWNDVVGTLWVANQARLDRLMAPLTEALLQVAMPAAGERVADIGCGCGDLSLRIAEAIGPTGKVLGIDVSKPMLAHASSRSLAVALDARAPIAWLEADAMTYAFEPACDLVMSRFGVMFFDDKPRAFANLRTALRPGGRFAFLAWRGRAAVEWFQAPLDWVAPVLPMPASIDGAVGPCGLADCDATRNLLTEAGFREVLAAPMDRALVLGQTVDEAIALLLDAGPTAALLREADPRQRMEAEKLLRHGLERHISAGGVELRGAGWIYSGVL